MKVLLHTAWSRPESMGGTEIYVDALARELSAAGVEVVVAAPADVSEPRTIDHEGIRIWNYPRLPVGDRLSHWMRPDPWFKAMAEWTARERPDVYHLHSWTPQTHAPHVRMARALGIPALITTHLASGSCFKSSMMLHDVEPCDGVFHVGRCLSCTGTGGGPRWLRPLLARTPAGLARWLADDLSRGLGGTMVGQPALLKYRYDSFRRTIDEVYRVITVCRWYRDALVANGVTPQRITTCPLGISENAPDTNGAPRRSGPVRLLFLGRMHPDKGPHLLARAAHSLPAGDTFEIVFHGASKSDEEKAVERELIEIAAADPRVRFLGRLPREQLWSTLDDFDVMVVPSIVYETGPLVVLEAQARGLPVLGSGFGGIAELVTEGVNGWLVPRQGCRTSESWAEILGRLARDPAGVRRLRRPPSKVRTMKNVGEEMVALYTEAVAAQRGVRA